MNINWKAVVNTFITVAIVYLGLHYLVPEERQMIVLLLLVLMNLTWLSINK